MPTDFSAVISPGAPGLTSGAREPSPTPAAPVKEEPPPAEAVEVPPESTGLVTIDEETRWPPNVAVLSVHMHGRDEFRLEGSNAIVGNLPYRESKIYRRPNLALGAMARQGGKGPRRIYQVMPEWSSKFREFFGWLNGLRDRIPEELHLLIIDSTGYEIPWELLYLPRSTKLGREAGWLGALVPTARWAHHALKDMPESSHGVVVGYLDGEVGGTLREQAVINQLEAVMHPRSAVFLEALCRARPEVGLVFMACHGLLEPATEDSTLGELSLGDLWQLQREREGLALLQSSRCIVFLNACHSGRLVHDDQLGDQPGDDLRGFVDVFLRNSASGVIATLGEVGTTFAANVAVLLLRQAMHEKGASIAKLLQNLRADEARKLAVQLPKEDRALLPFLYAFMYVFYGHPLTVLRLTRRSGLGDGG